MLHALTDAFFVLFSFYIIQFHFYYFTVCYKHMEEDADYAGKICICNWRSGVGPG